MTKVNIISGFLGCGKTTFIKKLISQSNDFRNTVIIENEFGEVGIDGKLLQSEGIEIKEINSGCICCSVAGDFRESIKSIINRFSPERIIIEPSGVGKLSDIKATCMEFSDVEIENELTIVDAVKYEMYSENFEEFFDNQIENSKIILLSRITYAKSLGENIFENAVNDLKRKNPDAYVCELEWDEFNAWDLIEGKISDNLNNEEQTEVCSHEHYDEECCSHEHGHEECCSHEHEHEECCSHEHGHGECCSHSHHADDVFETVSVNPDRAFSKDELESVLSNFNVYGNIVRAKGIVRDINGGFLQFDYVPYEIRIESMDYDGETLVAVIGENLDKDAVSRFFIG